MLALEKLIRMVFVYAEGNSLCIDIPSNSSETD